MDDATLRGRLDALDEDVTGLARDTSHAAARTAALMWFIEALIRTHPDRAVLFAALDQIRPHYEQAFPDGVEAHDTFLRVAAQLRQRCGIGC